MLPVMLDVDIEITKTQQHVPSYIYFFNHDIEYI